MRRLLFLSLISWVALCGFADTIRYTYDSAGRLVGADYGASGAISYSYDLAGNMTTRQVHSAAAGAVPEIQSVVNGARFVAGSGIAPGELISIFATNLGSKDQSSGFPSTNFLGVSVLFNGKAAPLLGLFASQNQINLVVPAGVTPGSDVPVVLTQAGLQSVPVTVAIK